MAMGSKSSAGELNPPWVRWLLPSAGDLFFIAFLALLVCTALSVRLLGDAGIGWHIRTGQLILDTHAFPRADPFSSSMSGQPWFAWEWLYDAIVGWLESVAGLNGVVLFTAVVIAAAFSFAFRMMLRRGANILMAAVLLLLAASAAMIHFLARPHVVSWLFTVWWFWILESSEENDGVELSKISSVRARRRWLLWMLPAITLVWVNVHGGFLLGFALLAIYWIGAVWQWFRRRGDRFEEQLEKMRARRRVRDLTWVGLLSAAVTFINPYGYHLHTHIYDYLTNRFLMDRIDEFQSPNFHYVAQKCFAALLLLTLVALAMRKRDGGGVSPSHGLVLLFAVYSGLYASRNIPVSSLLLILIIGPWLSDALERGAETRWGAFRDRRLRAAQFLRRMKAIEFGVRGHLWAAAAVVLACGVAVNGGRFGTSVLMNAHFDGHRFPVAAVDFIEKREVQEAILSPDDWGGYLIYRLYPRTKVVLDDRHDMYGEEFLKSYLRMMHAEPGWKDFLQQHPANCVIVPKSSALANLLAETTGWQPIYGDEVALAFVRVQTAGQ